MNIKQIQRMIADKKSKITPEELFSSPHYRSYLQNIADNISGKYGRGAFVSISYEPESEKVAFTDDCKIFLNTANVITSTFKTLAQKNLSCIGLIGHEGGHILFTDFKFAEKYCKALREGKLFPKKPSAKDFKDSVYKKNLEELTEVLEEKNTAKLRILERIAMHLSNIVEDGYVEYCMKLKFPGTISMGITLNNLRQSELAPSVKDMADKGYDSIAVIFNLLLQYCKTGKIENQEEVSNEYTDVLADCIQTLDEALSENNTKNRMSVINKLLVFTWSFIKELLDHIPDEDEDEENSGSENSNQNSNSKTVVENVLLKLSRELSSGSETPINMSLEGIDESERPEHNSSETERLKHEETNIENMIGEGSGTVEHDESYTTQTFDNELSNALNQVASEQVCDEIESRIAQSLNDDRDSINFGNIHKNVDIIIHRQRYLNGREKELYEQAMRELKPVSKMLQKAVSNVIKQRHRGSTERGFYMGSRLDHSAYYRNDGKIFTKRNRPNDEIDMAVAILVDQSGSMSGMRIATAQAMTLIVYDFCKAMNIPVTVYGHDEDGSVNLYSYAEFDSIDGNDKYRLMNINAFCCNRDGCAVRYVAEKLNRRNEATKLFIIVSDGQPASDGYYGTGAEKDLRNIRKEYVHKGLTFFAAAIGDDKEAIKRCYGEQAFLDITDLKKFPVTVAKLIAKYAIN